MSQSNPAFLTATEAAEAIQAGRLSPVELMEALLARIDAHDERLHAFAAVYATTRWPSPRRRTRQSARATRSAPGTGCRSR